MIPAFGYKNHVPPDQRHGLIRKWKVTSASSYDGSHLPDLIDDGNSAAKVWADTAYRSKKNEAFLKDRGITSMIHFRKPKGKALSALHRKANQARSKVRGAVEHVFAHQKTLMRLFVRTIGLGRATVKIGMVNLAYNMRRFIWLETRAAQG